MQPDPWRSELARRDQERRTELVQHLLDSPLEMHEQIKFDFEEAHADADQGMYDPDRLDFCPACGQPLPPGYLDTTLETTP